jgi:hypothetical protein
MVSKDPTLTACLCCKASHAHEPDPFSVRCAECGFTMKHSNEGAARKAWGAATCAPAAHDLQTRFIDEADAGQVGVDWMTQFGTSQSKIEYAESPPGRIPRLKWVAMFDHHDLLTHAVLFNRDEKNWTQLTRVTVTPPSIANALPPSVKPGSAFMVDMDSRLRHCEAFDDGKISTASVRSAILSYQEKQGLSPSALPANVDHNAADANRYRFAISTGAIVLDDGKLVLRKRADADPELDRRIELMLG